VPLPSTATTVVVDYTPPPLPRDVRAQERFASTGGGRGSTKSHSKHFHLKLLVPQSFMVRMLPGTTPKHSRNYSLKPLQFVGCLTSTTSRPLPSPSSTSSAASANHGAFYLACH
jgi:hypothetical protein